MSQLQVGIAAPVNLDYKFKRWQFKGAKDARKKIYAKLSKLISNGVSIVGALETMRDRRIATAGSVKKGLAKPDAFALNEWIVAMNNGISLSTAMKEWVGPDEAMLIEAGEQSGNLEEALQYVLKVLDSKAKIKSAVIGGILYPLMAISMGIVLAYLFGVKVVPVFAEASQGRIVWTGVAANLIGFSQWIQDWIAIVVGSIVALMVVFFVSLPRWDGSLRSKLDLYAPYSVYRILQGSSWLIAYAALVKSGMRLESAMDRLISYSSPWLRRRLQAVLRNMRAGYLLGDAMQKTGYQFPDKEIIDDLLVYSALSGIEDSLKTLGDEWIDGAIIEIQARMKVLFVVGMAIVGALLIFLIGGLFALQIQLTEGLGK